MDQFMEAAIAEARAGLAEGGIPIGSVLVRNGVIIGRGHNKRVQELNPMVHAEIDCLIQAGRALPRYRLVLNADALLPLRRCCRSVQHSPGRCW